MSQPVWGSRTSGPLRRPDPSEFTRWPQNISVLEYEMPANGTPSQTPGFISALAVHAQHLPERRLGRAFDTAGRNAHPLEPPPGCTVRREKRLNLRVRDAGARLGCMWEFPPLHCPGPHLTVGVCGGTCAQPPAPGQHRTSMRGAHAGPWPQGRADRAVRLRRRLSRGPRCPARAAPPRGCAGSVTTGCPRAHR